MSWHAFHIHYQNQADALIHTLFSKSIKPLLKQGKLTHWFFLRYWQQGVHIRLRVKLKQETDEATLNIIAQDIQNYIDEHPSLSTLNPERYRDIQTQLKQLEGLTDTIEPMRENNTFLKTSYQPEHTKYGGTLGIDIAENFFYHSSILVAELLEKVSIQGISRQSCGYLMLLAALKSANYSPTQSYLFLKKYQRYWQRYASKHAIKQWSGRFTKNKQALMDQARNVLEQPFALSEHCDWFNTWYQLFQKTYATITHPKNRPLLESAITLNSAVINDPLGYLVFHYLHTHNNRLGLLPQDEAYLAYLAQRSLLLIHPECRNVSNTQKKHRPLSVTRHDTTQPMEL